MNILVLGALGHLGTNFIISQKKHYETIIALDKISYCSQSKTLIAEHVSRFIEADILQVNLFDIIVWNEIDLVLNAAGSTHVDRSYIYQDEFIRDNITVVDYIMQTISKLPHVKLIHLSTDEIYGDNYETPRTELDMPSPTNLYSASKASGDMVIQSYIHSYDLDNVLVLRPNNLTGDHQYPDKAIPLFTRQIKNKEMIKVHDFGTQRRCFIETKLVCDIITELYYRSYRWPKDNPFVNVGYDDQSGVSILGLIKILQFKLSKFTKMEFTKGRPHNDKHYMICNSKLKNILHDSEIIHHLQTNTKDILEQK